MSNLNQKRATLAASRNLFLSLLGIAALVTSGCSTSERDADDGEVITNIVLDSDVVLGLFCEDVGVFPEPCVLDDPANSFAGTFIPEFDPNRTGPTKFELADELRQNVGHDGTFALAEHGQPVAKNVADGRRQPAAPLDGTILGTLEQRACVVFVAVHPPHMPHDPSYRPPAAMRTSPC